MPEAVFAEWKALELSSINMLLWACWGVFVVSIVVGGMLLVVFPRGEAAIQCLCLIAFIAGVIVADQRGKQVAQLKKQYGIEWPRRR